MIRTDKVDNIKHCQHKERVKPMEKARFYNPRTGETEEIDVEYYAEKFSEEDFWSKVKNKIKSAGLQLIYKAMQLYYATENPNCPTKVKAGIYAALGYFIAPFDFLPDFMPFAGYTDDLSAILLATMMAQAYIDDEIKEKARQKLGTIFGHKVIAELSEEQAA